MSPLSRPRCVARPRIAARLRSIVVAGILVMCAACGEQPTDGYDAFLGHALKGEIKEAFLRFSSVSRQEMRDLAASGKTDGLSAEDYLFRAFDVKPAEHVVEVSKDGDRAVIAVIGFDGKRTMVPMRREDGRWRIHASTEP